jgi:hypothetical protein
MEFINHPQITRIFKVDIEVYGITSITVDENDAYLVSVVNANNLEPSSELLADIKYAAITAKYEDESAIDVHEETDTINAAIESRKNR